jgi:lipoprotein-releasing system ATP-binding protein
MPDAGGTDGEQRLASLAVDAAHRLLVLQGVHKSFDSSGMRIDILKDLHLALAAGETLAVVGASGIGKSTLLHIIGTLDRPDRGAVRFRGEDVLRFDHARLAQFRNECIGFVFQFHHLLPEFSALENTMMPTLIAGWDKRRARQTARTLLARVGLGARLHHRVGELSGGEQQRVALARALVNRPSLVLADEPTGNLDKRNSDHIHDLLMELNREYGATLIVVTHNMALASLMARRVTIVDGQLMETP